MAKVWVIGSLNVDRGWRVARHPLVGETVLGEMLAPAPGGKGLNTAVAARRAGAEVVLVGAVGGDADGRWLRGLAADEGIDCSRVVTSTDRATGSALIVIGNDGANTVTVDAGANATLDVTVDAGGNATLWSTPGLVADLGADDVVVAQLEVPVAAVAAAFDAARAVGARSVLNPSPIGDGVALVAQADVVVVNQPEAASLAGADRPARTVAEALVQARAVAAGMVPDPVERPDAGRAGPASGPVEEGGAGVDRDLLPGQVGDVGSQVVRAASSREGPVVRTVVVTLGEAGVVAVGPDGEEVVAGRQVEVVDTTGAGDCFCGVLAATLAAGHPLAAALERANRAAALAVGLLGTVAAMPNAAAIDRA